MFGAVLAAAGVSGILGLKAADEAADAQVHSANIAADVQRQAYKQTREDLAPYRDAGVPALQKLMHLTGVGKPMSGEGGYGDLMRDFTLQDFAKDPGYQFRQEEGEKALTRSNAARGLAKSSPGLRSLMRFNQGLATEEFGAAYGRFEASKGNKFNLLSYLSGTGQNAAAMTGTAGTNAAAGASQAIMAGGAGAAQGITAGYGAINNAIQGGLGNYMYQSRFDEMMKRFPVFGSTPSAPIASSIMAPAGMGG